MKGWFIPHAMRLPPAFCQQYTLRYTIEEKFINLQNWRNKGIFRLSSVLELPGNQSFVCNKISEKFTMAHENFPPKCMVFPFVVYSSMGLYLYMVSHSFFNICTGEIKNHNRSRNSISKTHTKYKFYRSVSEPELGSRRRKNFDYAAIFEQGAEKIS